jgi:hypothetical protein
MHGALFAYGVLLVVAALIGKFGSGEVATIMIVVGTLPALRLGRWAQARLEASNPGLRG